MQIKGLHKNIYKLYAYARTQETLEKYRKQIEDKVRGWESLKRARVSDNLCHSTLKISRATYFRYKKRLERLNQGIMPPSKKPRTLRKPLWGESEKQKVLSLRREYPTYGKAKIAVILKRDHGLSLSESTVGRILNALKAKGLVTKSASAPRGRKRRNFTKTHAKPWVYKDYDVMEVGERVQIDHMTVTKNNLSFKYFQAWDRRSKFIWANIYSNAKSLTAKKFLLELIEKAPFKILSIQVDGGSEFMAEFEQACQELNIPLMVLPPAKHTYNGGVERGNRIFREELYPNPRLLDDSIQAMRFNLKKALHTYNTFRPHFSLKGLTPMQYIHNLTLEIAA
jgi:putative transposase